MKLITFAVMSDLLRVLLCFVFAGEEAKSGEKEEEAQAPAPAPATGEAKTEEQTAVKSDK